MGSVQGENRIPLLVCKVCSVVHRFILLKHLC